MLRKKSFIMIFILFGLNIYGQNDTISLYNGSFEDVPKRGETRYWTGIKGWTDCAALNNFFGESPPDIHPNGFWENNLPASEGKTYLGMVTRDNNTYESVTQRLSKPMKAGKCYAITVHLARAERYVSHSRMTSDETNYSIPVTLRIWGGATLCQEMELLAISEPVKNHSWQIFSFKMKPKRDILYLTFAAYYKTPALPYNGNLLLDGASNIVSIPCNENAPLIVNSEKKQKNTPTPTKKTTPKNSGNSGTSKTQTSSQNSKLPVEFKPKIMLELNRTNFKPGETFQIKNLYFQEDSAIINQNSYPALDEISGFLEKNKNIVIEIGGHTNNIPNHDYCDRLSTKRAKTVAEYLINKGLSPERVQFKGYGKRNPIATNKTVAGRKKNQRVELKILSIRS